MISEFRKELEKMQKTVVDSMFPNGLLDYNTLSQAVELYRLEKAF